SGSVAWTVSTPGRRTSRLAGDCPAAGGGARKGVIGRNRRRSPRGGRVARPAPSCARPGCRYSSTGTGCSRPFTAARAGGWYAGAHADRVAVSAHPRALRRTRPARARGDPRRGRRPAARRLRADRPARDRAEPAADRRGGARTAAQRPLAARGRGPHRRGGAPVAPLPPRQDAALTRERRAMPGTVGAGRAARPAPCPAGTRVFSPLRCPPAAAYPGPIGPGRQERRATPAAPPPRRGRE